LAAEPALILIVDDEPLNVDLLGQELEGTGLRTIAAGSGDAALALAAKSLPDLILLDVRMHGLDGYETCRRLKAQEATRSIPVIFLTALTDPLEKMRAFEAGAVDHVGKPFEPAELLARVGVHLALRQEIEAHRRSKATIRALVDEQRLGSTELVGTSPALRRVRELVSQVAPTDSTVLIQGETGTGKEMVARAVHAASGRRDRPLIKLN
jgi:DNA-binding NtrC family response regulator